MASVVPAHLVGADGCAAEGKLGVLQRLAYPLFLWILFIARGPEQLSEEVFLSWAALQALVYAIPVFVIFNVIAAALQTKREIAKLGTWHGPRFVYHMPHYIYTAQFGPAEHEQTTRFKVEDAEPNTFVAFHLEHYGGLGATSISDGPALPLHGFGAIR